MGALLSQCTYRCVVLPRLAEEQQEGQELFLSQCTYRCVVLPDRIRPDLLHSLQVSMHLQVRGAP